MRKVNDSANLESVVVPLSVAISIVGAWALLGPMYAIGLAAIPVLVLLVWRWPEVVICFVAVATLTGGNFAGISSLGVLASYVALVVLLPRVLSGNSTGISSAAFALVLPILVGARLLIEGNIGDALVTVRIAGVIILVAATMQTRKLSAIYQALGYAGIAFIAITVVLGEYTDTGLRLAGISGNPNRMVMGTLILVPFAVKLAWQGRSAVRVLCTTAITVIAIYICVMSGSSQALAGLLAAGAFASVALLGRLPPGVRRLAVVVLLGLWGFAAGITLKRMDWSEDLRTLSGRLPLYQSAIQEVLSAPLLGSGRVHVEEGLNELRSAHSALLGLTATAGLVAGLVWLALILLLVKVGLQLAYEGNPISISFLVLAILQFVQSVEYAPTTWIIVFVALWIYKTQQNRKNDEEHQDSTRIRQLLPTRGGGRAATAGDLREASKIRP